MLFENFERIRACDWKKSKSQVKKSHSTITWKAAMTPSLICTNGRYTITNNDFSQIICSLQMVLKINNFQIRNIV